MADKSLQQYEMMIMLKPDLTQKATKEALQTIRDFLAEAGGKINHEDIWEKRDMAYLIKSYSEAYYVVFYFTLNADKLIELKANLDLEQQILRKMIIKFPASLTLEGYLDETKRILVEEEAIQAAKAVEMAAREEKQAAAAEARAARMKKKEDTAPKSDASDEPELVIDVKA